MADIDGGRGSDADKVKTLDPDNNNALKAATNVGTDNAAGGGPIEEPDDKNNAYNSGSSSSQDADKNEKNDEFSNEKVVEEKRPLKETPFIPPESTGFLNKHNPISRLIDWANRMAFKVVNLLPPNTVAFLGISAALGYSLVLTFMPGVVLRWVCGNGFVENWIQRNAKIRDLADAIVIFVRSEPRLAGILSVFVAIISIGLLPVIIAFKVATNPMMVRAIAAFTLLPNTLATLYWKTLIVVFPDWFRKQQEAMLLIGASAFSALCIAFWIAVGMMLFPDLVKWACGSLSVPMYTLGLVIAMIFATVLAVVHVEGQRTLQGGVGSMGIDTVYSASMLAACLATVAMLMVSPILNRKQFARIRMLNGD